MMVIVSGNCLVKIAEHRRTVLFGFSQRTRDVDVPILMDLAWRWTCEFRTFKFLEDFPFSINVEENVGFFDICMSLALIPIIFESVHINQDLTLNLR